MDTIPSTGITELTGRLDDLLSILRPTQSAEDNVENGLKLGFQESERPDVVYIGESVGRPWYRYFDEKQHPVQEDCIVGRISGIALRNQPNERHGDKIKMSIGIDAGKQKVRLSSTITTYFSRGVLASLLTGQITKRTLIRLKATLGDEGKVVFSDITLVDTGMRVENGDMSKTLMDEETAIAAAKDAADKVGVPFVGLKDDDGGSNPISRKARSVGTAAPSDDDPPF